MVLWRDTDHYRLETVSWQGKTAVRKQLKSAISQVGRTLEQEIQILRLLSALPGIPRILHSGETEYVREYVNGSPLAECAGKLSLPNLLATAVAMIRIVGSGHGHGVLFGDLKPANFIRDDNRVTFIDFSLAAIAKTGLAPCHGGTPAYMAPELFYGGFLSTRADIYALGITLYELTAARTPFAGADWRAIARAHWLDDAPDPTLDTAYPTAWGCLILRMIDKNPANRFADGNEIIRRINFLFDRHDEPVTSASALTDSTGINPVIVDAASAARRVLKTILADNDRTATDSELAARLALRAGDFPMLDKLLGGVAEPARSHLKAMRAVKTGNSDEAERLATALVAEGEYKAENILGTCAYYRGDHAGALAHYRRLVKRLKAEKRFDDIVPVLNNLANTELASANRDEAESTYAQALTLAKMLGNPRHQALAMSSLGGIEHRAGRWGRALRHYSEAARIHEWLGDEGVLRQVRLNSAGVLHAIGADREAQGIVEEVMQVAKKSGDRLTEAQASALTGDLQRSANAGESAIAAYRLAAELFDSAGQPALADTSRLAIRRLNTEMNPSGVTEANDVPQDTLARWQALAPLWTKKGEPDVNAVRQCWLAGTDTWEAEDRLTALALLSASTSADAEDYRRRYLDERVEAALELEDVYRDVFTKRWPVPQTVADTRYTGALVEISTRLIAELDVNKLLKEILDRLIDFTGSERGFIITRENGQARIALSRRFSGTDIAENARKISWTIALQVMDEAAPILTLDAQHDDRFEIAASLHHLRLRSIICLPFVYRGEVLGAIYLDSKAELARGRENFTRALEPFAAQMAVAIHNARTFGETRHELGTTRRELSRLKKISARREEENGLICRSDAMAKVMALVDRVAPTRLPVLITGESGAGKEKIARLIHTGSPRKARPFVAINCSAIPLSLLESELFGYKKGAFTGADRDKKGLIETAHEGTLFLDEIGELEISLQAKLLRFLEEGEFTPLGAEKSSRADVRVITATNRDLKAEIVAKNFREDLFYRLQVAEIRVPPLRERREEIPYLARHFLKLISEKEKLPLKQISAVALDQLIAHDWPGNIRELEHLIYRLAVFHEGDTITDTGLQGSRGGTTPVPMATVVAPVTAADGADDFLSLPQAKKHFERQRIIEALSTTRGNVSHAALRLKIARPQLCALLREHGIDRLAYTG